jgi:predicted TIM-barrel fold metal-dependent hydrolase
MTPAVPNATRIIDCHGHFGYYTGTKIIPADAESMIQVMDKAGVEKLCMSAFLSIGPDCKVGNDMVAEAVKKYPNRFVGYGVVNPNRPQEIEGELRRCFEDLGMRAIKLHPASHRVPIESSVFKKVFEFAANKRLPILSHEWGSPKFLDQVSSNYPEISFIMAHMGFWDGRGDFAYADVVASRQNVYVDLAYSNVFYEALERLVAVVGPTKVVFGSDFPLHDPGYQLGRVTFSKLLAEEQQMILGLNMLRILGESPQNENRK